MNLKSERIESLQSDSIKPQAFLNIFYPLEKLQIFTSNKPQTGEQILPYSFDLETPQDLFYFTVTIRKKNQLK